MRWMKIVLTIALLAALSASSGISFAASPSISIDAPTMAMSGQSVPITVTVSNAYESSHYVDSVRLYDGNTLLNEFVVSRKPTMTLSFSTSFTKSATLKAVAHDTVYGDITSTKYIKVG